MKMLTVCSHCSADSPAGLCNFNKLILKILYLTVHRGSPPKKEKKKKRFVLSVQGKNKVHGFNSVEKETYHCNLKTCFGMKIIKRRKKKTQISSQK